MSNGEVLNERAASPPGGLNPMWHVANGWALFAGPLQRNASHRHSVPVYLCGLYGAFRLRIGMGQWTTCRAAVVPAGIAYEFDMSGEPLAVLYLEPNVAGADSLVPLLRQRAEMGGALVGRDGELQLLRELYEDGNSARWVGPALSDLMGVVQRRSAKAIDPRVARVVEALHRRYDDYAPAAQVAAAVGLSASRFQHLFTREVGVPFRRYRAWHRLRAAIREIVNGSSFAAAAHEAGFADQPHFAREFRRTFGAPASPGLARVRA